MVVKVFSELLLLNDELLDGAFDCNVANVIWPLLGFPPCRSASRLNKSNNLFGFTGRDKKCVAVPLFVNDEIFELLYTFENESWTSSGINILDLSLSFYPFLIH